MQIWTVIGWSPVSLASWVEVVAAPSAAAAAGRVLEGTPAWMMVRFAQVFEGRARVEARVEALDVLAKAMQGGRPPPIRRGRGLGLRAYSVAAIWLGSGEALSAGAGCSWVRSADGIEAMSLVQTTIGRSKELQVIAALEGHVTPVLAAVAGTPPRSVGPPASLILAEVGGRGAD